MNIQVEITTRCNFDCFYCAGRDMPQKDMPLEQYMSIVGQHVARYGVPKQISLQGEGEPTINKAFFQMAEHARQIGALPFTITNGTYKHPEHFIEHFPSVGVSIDTLDADEAERIGRHNLERVLAFVDALAQRLKIVVFSTATSDSVKDVAAWCRSNRLQHVVQPLQSKPDYQYRYPLRAAMPVRPSHFSCAFLDRDLMRYYSIDGTELPCCFIKDTRHYTSIADLRQRIARRSVPPVCSGCRYLK